jgi:ABC-type thiamin/hydroxymethylpyrimidine transport system permease subunit
MPTKPVQELAIRCAVSVQARAVEMRRRGERGDVPGWVLITLMTALIVAALLAIARPRLTAMLNKALKDFS